jgi:hypothetical protein
VRVSRIAALSEVAFVILMAALALRIPVGSSHEGSSALAMLVAQMCLALLAAMGLLFGKRWGWPVALCVIALAFGPLGIAVYRVSRAGGVGVVMPVAAMKLLGLGWCAQLVVVACFLTARGRRTSTTRTS